MKDSRGHLAAVPIAGARAPSFWEAFRFWLKLGLVSFGGPAAQISIMHQELVEKKRWISEDRFLFALNYCMLLPGPEAQQLATYLGWLLHKTTGGLVAGTLFVLPGAVLLWALSWTYVLAGHQSWVGRVFYGLKPAVLAIVLCAVLRLGSKALKNKWMTGLAGAAFVAIYFLKVPFPFVILAAVGAGLAAGRGLSAEEAGVSGSVPLPSLPPVLRVLRTAVLGVVLWMLPLVLAGIFLGTKSVIFQQGVFFSKAAMLTFGGAYAVLPYVAQQAVEAFGWLAAAQMFDGLALAETTPGPLILVLEFVGFLGAWNHPAPFSPLLSGTLGALITVWCTFAPSFVWIFLGAPFIERLRGNRLLSGALSAVSAAVVGVILNLACWFGGGILFPQTGGVDGVALVVSSSAFLGMVRWKWGVIPVLIGAGVLGVLCKGLL
ncbi:MAG: chromate transporter [Verrucomicrobia bacterium]|nr:MAG: chromate transporter [Verrucomicrobiota bacterium]